jgi:hypothetical protein
VQVVPAGTITPVVINADLDLVVGQTYTVAAVGLVAEIEPLVIIGDRTLPAAGQAHVRFVHASPGAPAVDVAVAGGDVLFENVAFQGSEEYLPVPAGTYDLEVRLTGTDTTVLTVPGVALEEGRVYSIFAIGLAEGTPELQALLLVDN